MPLTRRVQAVVALVPAVPVELREATALDRVERGWRRQVQIALPVQRPGRQVRAQWERRQAVRRRK